MMSGSSSSAGVTSAVVICSASRAITGRRMSRGRKCGSRLTFRPMTVDHDALREKYREERDKRLRPDGNDQYLEPTGRFASMLDDPYTERIDRAPRTDEVTVALIGGGFS